MTNNAEFKKDSEELFNKLLEYKRNYHFMSGGRLNTTGVDELERQLRMVLEIVRTDEENDRQYQRDSYC